jgi:hypothetical protein
MLYIPRRSLLILDRVRVRVKPVVVWINGLFQTGALQDQQVRSRVRLEAGFQAMYLRQGVCEGVVGE